MREILEGVCIAMAIALVTLGIVAGSMYLLAKNTPLSYRACTNGWGAVCIRFKDYSEVREENGCLIGKTGRVCGSYWVKEDRW